jgi:vacuolar-type H+-ATPase subunit E/Vma4
VNVAPLQTFLMAAAERDAAALVAAAEQDAAAGIAAVQRDADERVAAATAAAHAEAASRQGRALAAARAEARAAVVHARGAAVAEAVAAARAAADVLRREPGYDALLDGLEARARRELGPDADVVRDPPAGGLFARRGAALIDLTLPALLALALDEHPDAVAELWR